MTVGDTLRAALVDFYEQSWRLLLLNTTLSATAIAIVWTAFYTPVALALIVVLGPLAAALMHCAVKLVREDELHLGDALEGVALHWRRGLALGTMAIGAAVLTFFALRFYAGLGTLAWPLGILALYLALLFGVYQLSLWPLAVFERDRAFRAVLADAAIALVRRPAASVGLTLALLLVNLAGLAAAVIPFLTLTIAYSFLAAAHFALPRELAPEA
jgi:hypothetical protein